MSVRELIEIVPHFDGWIIGDDPATEDVLRAGIEGRLKAVVKWGIGVDNIDLEFLSKSGLKFSNTPNMFGSEVADLAIHYLIGLARRTYEVHSSVVAGGWQKPTGQSLSSMTIGVVGYGDIGKSVVTRLESFGPRVVIFDPASTEKISGNHVKRDWTSDLSDLDFIVLTCSLNRENLHMINESSISRMKHSVGLVNVARGGLIREKDLEIALAAGRVSSCALDVFEIEPLPLDSGLRKFSNVVFGSHNGSNTFEAVGRASIEALNLIDSFLS